MWFGKSSKRVDHNEYKIIQNNLIVLHLPCNVHLSNIQSSYRLLNGTPLTRFYAIEMWIQCLLNARICPKHMAPHHRVISICFCRLFHWWPNRLPKILCLKLCRIRHIIPTAEQAIIYRRNDKITKPYIVSKTIDRQCVD